jgi:hypothetical protein
MLGDTLAELEHRSREHMREIREPVFQRIDPDKQAHYIWNHCQRCQKVVADTALCNVANCPLIKDSTHSSGEKSRDIYLPGDASSTIDHKALNWLAKYGIMRSEIVEHKLKWSESREWLIFPFYGTSDQLLAYQARTFNPKDTKWQSRGRLEDILHIIGDHKQLREGKPLVLVEDVVSAIKIGRWQPAMPLFGSSFYNRLLRIKFYTKNLVVWLDADKALAAETRKALLKAKMLGFDIRNVYTDKDPKDYRDTQIIATLK